MNHFCPTNSIDLVLTSSEKCELNQKAIGEMEAKDGFLP